jgi:peptidoglycan/xylan/chitin deacetylase (PgdA/CDA1 family)
VSILCYHSVDPSWRSPLSVTPEAFEAQSAWLARHRRVIGVSEAAGRVAATGRLHARVAAITFDDGFRSVFDHAFPVLMRHRLPATVFLVAQTLTPEGRPVDWVDDPPVWSLSTLTLGQIREMQEAGIGFGSHSYAHHDLTTLSDEECERDLRASRELLEDVLETRIRLLAYPRGLHDERVRTAAGRAGFAQAFTLPERREPIGPFSVPRVGVYPGNGIKTLRAKTSRWYLPVRTSGAFPILRRLAGRGRARHLAG